MKKMMKAQEGNKQKIYDATKTYQPNLIVATVTTLLECTSVASRLGAIPTVIACTFPAHPTDEFAPVTLMGTVPEWLQRPVASVMTSLFWKTIQEEYETWRRTLFLRPLPAYNFAPAPHINLFSVILSPRPRDWPGYVYDVGFMMAKPKPGETLSEEIEAFLAAGSKPIYMGFGSMPMRNLAQLALDFSSVCKELNQRGIVCSGWFDLGKGEAAAGAPIDLGPHMLHIKSAPHSLLFPRCAAAIHHGGAGTTAATLHAGIPCVIFPVIGDQPYWASQCAKLGVGPPMVIDIKGLNRGSLLSQLKSVLDDGGKTAKAASDIGEKLRAQDSSKVIPKLLHNLYLWIRPQAPLEDHFGEDEEPAKCKVCKTVEFGLLTRKHQVRLAVYNS
jgi:sterol 3beta-glucosyltransferase